MTLNQKRNSTNNSKLTKNDINKENINLINQIYDKDFRLFGYEKI